jgi:hypothetical protein
LTGLLILAALLAALAGILLLLARLLILAALLAALAGILLLLTGLLILAPLLAALPRVLLLLAGLLILAALLPALILLIHRTIPPAPPDVKGNASVASVVPSNTLFQATNFCPPPDPHSFPAFNFSRQSRGSQLCCSFTNVPLALQIVLHRLRALAHAFFLFDSRDTSLFGVVKRLPNRAFLI